MNLDTSLTVAGKGVEGNPQKEEHHPVHHHSPPPPRVRLLAHRPDRYSATLWILSNYQLGLESLTYFFVVLAAVLPASIAAYSIVGEKIEKSLEPLLATPATDGEILLGKSIAAFVPPILTLWAGASIFMVAADYLTYSELSYNFFPNWTAGIMLFLLAPLAAIFSIECAVIASSRVTDARGANQIASLMFIPFMAIFLLGSGGSLRIQRR